MLCITTYNIMDRETILLSREASSADPSACIQSYSACIFWSHFSQRGPEWKLGEISRNDVNTASATWSSPGCWGNGCVRTAAVGTTVILVLCCNPFLRAGQLVALVVCLIAKHGSKKGLCGLTHPVEGGDDDLHLDDRPLFVRAEHRINAVLPPERVGPLCCRLQHIH